MVIMSAKVSKRKLLTGLLAAVAVIVLLVVLFSGGDGSGSTEEPGLSLNAGTNEERLAFLAQYGWEADPVPLETQEVRVPEEWNEVFTRYNQLQQSMGYDLTPYGGKAVKRYVYEIRNHPNGQDYYATVLIYKNEIIGGDITGTGKGGTMHGFQMPT